jgi:hypothetical protein
VNPTPYILGNQWPTPKVRWNGTQEREQCEKCGRWCVVSGIGRHKAKCLGVLKPDPGLGIHHTICGLNGCLNFKRLDAQRCYVCGPISSEMDELDRKLGTGRYKAVKA